MVIRAHGLGSVCSSSSGAVLLDGGPNCREEIKMSVRVFSSAVSVLNYFSFQDFFFFLSLDLNRKETYLMPKNNTRSFDFARQTS